MIIEFEITAEELVKLSIPPAHAESMLKAITPKFAKELLLKDIEDNWTPFFKKYADAFNRIPELSTILGKIK